MERLVLFLPCTAWLEYIFFMIYDCMIQEQTNTNFEPNPVLIRCVTGSDLGFDSNRRSFAPTSGSSIIWADDTKIGVGYGSPISPS